MIIMRALHFPFSPPLPPLFFSFSLSFEASVFSFFFLSFLLRSPAVSVTFYVYMTCVLF